MAVASVKPGSQLDYLATPTMKKILLIEDEIHVVSFIKKGLTEENYEVSVALNGCDGENMACQFRYDLIILDIMLPDKSGLEVCKELRRKNCTTPILFLSALNTADNIAHGLNTGADDYLVKPFKFIELVARINAIMRRQSYSQALPDERDSVFVLADLILNDDARTVVRGHEAVSLTATEYRLLLTLIKNKGRVMSRADLLESVWDINFNLGTNVVDVYINYLRKKIDSNYENKLIHTVIGMGYVMKEA